MKTDMAQEVKRWLAGTSRCKWQGVILRGINALLCPWIFLFAKKHPITKMINSSRILYFL